MGINEEKVTITTTGSAGSATGEAYSPAMDGFLLDIYLDYNASAPATTDLTVTDAQRGDTLLTLTSTATDARVALREQAKDNAGALIGGLYELYPLNGSLKFALAQCDALAVALTVYIRYLEA